MIVLDCSAALEIALKTPRGLGMQSLFLLNEDVIAPEWFRAEVANSAWKYFHTKRMSEEEARRLMEDALSLPDRLVPIDDMLDEAFAESVALDHCVYDMLYLVLTRRNVATLATCDSALRDCCLKRNVNCMVEVDL